MTSGSKHPSGLAGISSSHLGHRYRRPTGPSPTTGGGPQGRLFVPDAVRCRTPSTLFVPGPWSHITVDFVTGLPPSSNHTVILTIIDRFFKAAYFVALPKLFLARETADLITNHVVRLHGIPQDIVSDRGPLVNKMDDEMKLKIVSEKIDSCVAIVYTWLDNNIPDRAGELSGALSFPGGQDCSLRETQRWRAACSAQPSSLSSPVTVLAIHSTNTIVKFADDTTTVGVILDNDKTHFREEIQHLTQWCSNNNLVLNTSKNQKEVIVDYRRSRRTEHTPLLIYWGSSCRACQQHQVPRHLHITSDLTWSMNTAHLVKKAQQRLFFLRKLKRAGLSPQLLTNFYRATIESIPPPQCNSVVWQLLRKNIGGPTLEPGLGLGLAGERLVAGSLPMGPGRAQPEMNATWARLPSSRLTTHRKVHEGPVQCGLGSSRGRGPRRPNPWTKTLAIGTWNVTSLGGKEPELVREVERYRLEIVGLTSTHSLGSGTQLLERGWTLHYSGVAQGERRQELVWALYLLIAPQLSHATCWSSPRCEREGRFPAPSGWG
ncbi:hypothetical protein L3Q82_004508 [Scortum barcoo]|uniref:Uncharacterized protein n=1 Tax=Scortum barcoo TaxID=214431 RepID=A0ACB8VGA5_9TELE|nr:hypothetical protein L3Q82_004508 [Scortum barcoo]